MERNATQRYEMKRRHAARKYVKVLLLSPNKLANATGCRLFQALRLPLSPLYYCHDRTNCGCGQNNN